MPSSLDDMCVYAVAVAAVAAAAAAAAVAPPLAPEMDPLPLMLSCLWMNFLLFTKDQLYIFMHREAIRFQQNQEGCLTVVLLMFWSTKVRNDAIAGTYQFLHLHQRNKTTFDISISSSE